MSRVVLALGLLSLPATGAGCADGRDRGEPAGTTLTILYAADERLFGPYWSMDSWFLMFLPLATYDEHGEAVGRLARSWKASDDLRSWTFYLRSDVRWHDGQPTTAHDVKFSIELAGHPEILFDDPWHDVDSIAVRDDTTLTIYYGRPKDARNTWMVYWPKHLLEALHPAEFYGWDFWTRPVGNGPLRYVRHVPKTMVELEANPDHYTGRPAIDRVIMKFGSHGLTELLSGNVDVAEVNPAELPKLAADPHLQAYYQILPDVAWLSALVWNHRHPALGDARMRRALTHAIDRRELLRLLNLPEDLLLSDGLFTPRQYHRSEVPPALEHDPARAARLLEEAGWRDGDGDGVRERDGAVLRFTLLLVSEGSGRQIGVYVQAAFRRVGVAMEIQPLDIQVLRQRVRTGAFDAVLFPFFNHLDGHLDWLGGGAGYGGASVVAAGIPGYENAEVTRLLWSVKQTADAEAVDSIYRKLAPLLLEELPLTFLVPQVGVIAAHRRVKGLESPFRADPMRYVERLWIEEEKE